MPRQTRVIVPGFPLHIVQRGHNRQPVFVERQSYLDSSIDEAALNHLKISERISGKNLPPTVQ